MMQPFGAGEMPPPLRNIRIRVSSDGQVVETRTRDDGSFLASGIAPGFVEVTAALGPELTIVERPTYKPHVCDGERTNVHLRAAVNGRVRGRIISATGGSVEKVQLHLRVARDNRHAVSSPHDRQFGTTAREDGTFEFSGVSGGTYL